MKTLCLFCFLLIFCPATPAFCQTERIDSLLTTAYQNHNLNGSILVAEKGKVLYSKSFGYANTDTRMANSESTRFQLASIGKTFTAVAVLQLSERKKLKLDDPVVKYIPDFPFAKITIRQLLSHTSGLPDLQIFNPFVNEQPDQVIDNALVIPALKRYDKLEFPSGEKWGYSNPGYCVLALIVEKVSKLKFMDYLSMNIWKPADMTDTYSYSAAMSRPDPLRAESYRMPIFSYQLQKVDTMRKYKALLINFGGLQGLGFVASTTADLLRFDQALYNGALLKPATLEEAYRPQKLNSGEQAVVEPGRLTFGLGWFISTDTTGGKIVSHSGFIPGGATMFSRNVTRQQAVIVLDNGESDGLHLTAENVMQLMTGRKIRPQKKSLVKVYTNDLLIYGADLAAAHFHELKPDTVQYRFSPGEMDYAARELNAAGHKSAALETSKLLTFIDPAWQTFNSYAELLLTNGKSGEAKIMFRKSLSINPENHFAKEALAKLGSD
ncbi:D-aminopeptidase [Dyadobacter sp. CECT 9275]|uniref:D-aminopeptidase n=1 Tax=Dyadobacter helix TaxID=2822344 RepID=A0A916NCK3_9BACT|nr:serine hydrolase domain-containing protein [Dyadobacter sp. CECT 9275]CAG5002549.1 D-aminopeptidase [Dyadobacter sp. CECT 9275]